jgi:CMP-N-acetylneuraminic acid synthetase
MRYSILHFLTKTFQKFGGRSVYTQNTSNLTAMTNLDAGPSLFIANNKNSLGTITQTASPPNRLQNHHDQSMMSLGSDDLHHQSFIQSRQKQLT